MRASKSGRTIYFNGKALKRAHLPSANHHDLVNREAYSGKVAIEAGVVDEYLRVTGSAAIDPTRFEVIKDIEAADPAKLYDQENAVLSAEAGRRTRR